MNGQIIALLDDHSGNQVNRQANEKWDRLWIALGALFCAIVMLA